MASPEETAGSLLERSSLALLELFAAGRNTPGAGSAAALAGALAGSLLQAVAKYTRKAAGAGIEKAAEGVSRERAEALLREARERSARLRRAVDEDAAAFERFWRLREALRPGPDEPKGESLRTRAGEALRRATELPVEIAGDCAALAELGLELYDGGFANARAEASAAALGAIAGGEAALHAARLNARSAKSAPWAPALEAEIRHLRRRLRSLRDGIDARLAAGDRPA